MGDLLPCPFCGGEAFRRPTMRQFGNPAECRECGAVGPDPLIPVSWNTRYALPAAPAEDVRAALSIVNKYAEAWADRDINGSSLRVIADEIAKLKPAEDVRAGALKEAADVDWSTGKDVADTAPEYLTDWQRGFVAGQKAIRDAILALIPEAKP